jgi:fatty-acyl-CoA synthase
MKIIKGFPSTSQQNTQLNVINIVKHAARNFGRQEIASRKEDGSMFRYTYRDAYERMQRLANALGRIGAKAGDRIGVLSWNTHRNYEIYFGLPGTGAVMLLLNLRLAPHELSYVINHAKARFIIVEESLLDIIEEIAPRCKTVKGYVFITDKALSDIETNLKPIFSYEELLSEAASKYEWPHLDENSAYSGCYTTGTTGRPKGVYYSHRAEYLHALMYAANAGISVNDCVFQIVPMFHVLGWGTPQAATIAGAKLVFPGRYSLDELEELARIMVQEGVTVSNGAPAIFMPMLEYIRRMEQKPNLSGARFVCGATEPPMPMMRGYRDLTGADIIHSYGSTEAHAIVTVNHMKPWLERELSEEEKWDLKRKQGYIVVGLDVKLVDSEGKELPHDGKSAGEILIRGPWVSGSYYNTPGSEVQFTKDGYWRSGDAGTIDEEGYLKITDRVKDLIKSGGEWISSVDMENEIIAHPAILDAAVVGVAHPKWEERPLALVVLREEFREKVSGEEIREHLARKFARWQLPDEVIFVDAIPKTSVGKVDKKVIREEYRGIYTSR